MGCLCRARAKARAGDASTGCPRHCDGRRRRVVECESIEHVSEDQGTERNSMEAASKQKEVR